MNKNIEMIRFNNKDVDLDKIADLYCTTFLTNEFTFKDKENVLKNIVKHSLYDGFKGLKAKSEDGEIVGFSYGYTSLPDQFYREKIAKQLTGEERDFWLQDCFEFVELAVNPSYRRLGIASSLHDGLLKGLPHRKAILTTGITNEPAINLYRSRGWSLIKEDAPVISFDNLQVIMGKAII